MKNIKTKIFDHIRLLRIDHYLKNLLIFSALFFSGKMFSSGGGALNRLIYALVPFCLAASVVYIINDICDEEMDRNHPSKRNRPIASGAVSKKAAIVLTVCLGLVICLMEAAALIFGLYDFKPVLILLVFILINIAYTKGLKNVPIIDVAILTAGYIIRLFYGSAVCGIEISHWLYLTVMGGAFYLGIGKRRNELKKRPDSTTRGVLKHYNYNFLDKNMYVCAGFTEITYALWTIQSPSPALIWTVPFVIIIFMKYSLDIEADDSEGDPMNVVLHDKIIMMLSLLYGAAVFLCVYVFK